jgi:hypothetical protein
MLLARITLLGAGGLSDHYDAVISNLSPLTDDPPSQFEMLFLGFHNPINSAAIPKETCKPSR